jgi:hypothetical protein
MDGQLMRPLLQIAKLLDDAKAAKTPAQVQAALIAALDHLYRQEYERERNGSR